MNQALPLMLLMLLSSLALRCHALLCFAMLGTR
jgi:hypothetical protein